MLMRPDGAELGGLAGHDVALAREAAHHCHRPTTECDMARPCPLAGDRLDGAATVSWIALEGAVNVRDVGGLPTVDGRRTRPGVLRAGRQPAGPQPRRRRCADRRPPGCGTVVDLRTDAERELQGPTPLRPPASCTTGCRWCRTPTRRSDLAQGRSRTARARAGARRPPT